VADPASVDAIRFERLLESASRTVVDDASSAATMMIEALALWRGVPFGDLSDVVFLEPEVRRLEALRLSAIEVRLEADVERGMLTSAIASLEAETLENPYRERLWYLLVLALARDGRRVEALRACQQLRAVLGEVGLEPSTDLSELEAMVIEEAPMVRSHLARCTRSGASEPTQKPDD
jgi:DNA-binding SARP family transcriptional activator